MREVVILSGKGGTGKTSIAAAFATLQGRLVVADCDVDAADLHLILKPDVLETHDFTGGQSARIDPDKCTHCGWCAELCRFGAVEITEEPPACRIDETACEGCGVCAAFCPYEAVVMEDAINGQWFRSDTRIGPMLHARLRAGGENSGKLVTLVRNEARGAARSVGTSLVLTDGPPGIGCPVIASLTGAHHVVIVTEPTVSGFHDLGRVAKLAAHFGVAASVIVNKCDINPGKAAEIAAFAGEHGMETLGQVPYDPVVTEAQLAGKSVTEYTDGPTSRALRGIWSRIVETIHAEAKE